MPLVLRKISRSKWYQLTWMSSADVQGDSLKDLKTDDNVLSVWHVEDDRSNLDQVLTCLASNNDSVSHIDYALIDLNAVVALGINVIVHPGKTPYAVGNVWHRDLVELTGSKVLGLAMEIQREPALRIRSDRRHIANLLQAAIKQRSLDLSLTKPDLLKEIQKDNTSG